MNMRLAILALLLGLALAVSVHHDAQAGRVGQTTGAAQPNTVQPDPAYLAML